MCTNKMNRALWKKGKKVASKYISIMYLLKLTLTAPHSPDCVSSSKIVSSCGIQRASENILPDSYIHWSNRHFHNWISVLGGVIVYLSKSILKGLATDWDRTSHATLHTTKYAAHEFGMLALWEQTSSLDLTCKDKQTRAFEIFLSVGWAHLGKKKKKKDFAVIITHVQNSKHSFLPGGKNPQNISLVPNSTGLNLLWNSLWCPGALCDARTLYC